MPFSALAQEEKHHNVEEELEHEIHHLKHELKVAEAENHELKLI